jgi:YabP family.
MSIRKYIVEDEFKIIILKDKIDILNYKEIDSIEESKIIIRHEEGIVVLNGISLSIKKLLEDELLVSGEINKIEFR